MPNLCGPLALSPRSTRATGAYVCDEAGLPHDSRSQIFSEASEPLATSLIRASQQLPGTRAGRYDTAAHRIARPPEHPRRSGAPRGSS